jgi:hypothetical protein
MIMQEQIGKDKIVPYSREISASEFLNALNMT